MYRGPDATLAPVVEPDVHYITHDSRDGGDDGVWRIPFKQLLEDIGFSLTVDDRQVSALGRASHERSSPVPWDSVEFIAAPSPCVQIVFWNNYISSYILSK